MDIAVPSQSDTFLGPHLSEGCDLLPPAHLILVYPEVFVLGWELSFIMKPSFHGVAASSFLHPPQEFAHLPSGGNGYRDTKPTGTSTSISLSLGGKIGFIMQPIFRRLPARVFECQSNDLIMRSLLSQCSPGFCFSIPFIMKRIISRPACWVFLHFL